MEAAYAAGNEPRSTPPGDAEMNATNRQHGAAIKKELDGEMA